MIARCYEFFIYVYDADGKHADPIEVQAAGIGSLFETVVVPEVKNGREVVITDSDDFTVFHAKSGKIVFPAACPASERA